MAGLWPGDQFQVINRIEDCFDGTHKDNPLENVNRVAIHRTIWEPDDPVAICRRFQDGGDLAKYTGGENPYHFLIMKDGNVYQAQEIGDRGSHARRWNSSAVGVSLCHDTLRSPLPHEMGLALTGICRLLCLWLGSVNGVIYGHDELPGASKDPDKVCPGINMHEVRGLLTDGLRGWWGLDAMQKQSLLLDAGIVL